MAPSSRSRPQSVSSRLGDSDSSPPAKPWWFHNSPLQLDTPTAPLPKSALEEGTWKPFSPRDSRSLEEKWDSLPEAVKRKEEQRPDENGVVDELAVRNLNLEDLKNEEEVDDVSQDDAKVIVGVERLHHVDLVTCKYSPFHPFRRESLKLEWDRYIGIR